jgi:hypothetical protein
MAGSRCLDEVAGAVFFESIRYVHELMANRGYPTLPSASCGPIFVRKSGGRLVLLRYLATDFLARAKARSHGERRPIGDSGLDSSRHFLWVVTLSRQWNRPAESRRELAVSC